jgi:hypothetical protein
MNSQNQANFNLINQNKEATVSQDGLNLALCSKNYMTIALFITPCLSPGRISPDRQD